MNKLNNDILKIAIPSIITNITTPLLGLVDVGVTGHMGNPAYLAAIAVGSVMMNLVYWLMSFIRVSASGLTAQAYGRGDLSEQTLIITRELIISTTAGILFIALSPVYIDALVQFVDPSNTSTGLTEYYFQILLWGAPAALGTNALSGWFLGRQNSRITMWTSFAVNVTNLGLSLLLVYVFEWKLAGVATGTLVSQWLGFILLFGAMMKMRLPKVSVKDVFKHDALMAMFKVNTAAFLRTLCLIAVSLWFTRTGASQGDTVVAANAILMQLFLLFSYVMDGFAFAGEALVGKDLGARNIEALRKTIIAVMKFGVGLALLFTVVYMLAGESIMHILSDNNDIIETSKEYAGWAYAIPLTAFTGITWDGIMIGATLNRYMFASMSIAALAFFAVYLTAYKPMGNHGLWLAFLTYLFTRGAMQTLLWPHAKKKLINSIIR